MSREEIDANLKQNKAVKDEVMQLISGAFGVTSIRQLALMLGANHKTVRAALEDPDRYTGERPGTGRPSTGGASAYDIVHRIAEASRAKTKAEVTKAIIELLK
tara:strand:- start:315 stop:623 length:309 start_codon:yes stop_codon:yes gene_type:complete